MDAGQLMTDRSTYILYLESQLDRITSSCLTVQSFDARIEAVNSSVRTLEEKVLNVAKLVRSHQTFAEESEDVQRKTIEQLKNRVQLSHDLLFGEQIEVRQIQNSAIFGPC